MRVPLRILASVGIVAALAGGVACQAKPAGSNASTVATRANDAAGYCTGSIEEPWWLTARQTSTLVRPVTIVLAGDILFDRDSAELVPDAVTQLGLAVRLSSEHPAASITINGYTDSDGNPSTNIPLSTARAEAVARWLRSKGVSAARLKTKAWGDTHSVAPNDTPEHKALNRRVELVFSDRLAIRKSRPMSGESVACEAAHSEEAS